MTTLLVPVTTNFPAGTLNNIDVIDFTNAAATTATATFASSLFDNVRIFDFVLMDGSAGINAIVVNGGSVNASQWAFLNWTAGTDTIRLNGSGGADSITGSSQSDVIDGGQGADFLAGAGGDDIFDYSALELAAGESIQGGGGTGDTLRLNQAAGTYLFSTQATLLEVERLEFSSTNSITAELTGGQMADFTTILGGTGLDTLRILGAADLSTKTFTNWAANDVVRFVGKAAAETVTGTSLNDIFDGSAGADILNGGLGDDTFVYTQASQVQSGEQVNGGDGAADRIQLVNAGAIDFSSISISGIEALDFVSGNSNALLRSGQAFNLSTVDGSSGIDVLAVESTSSINLSGLTFANWTNGTDRVEISFNNTSGSITSVSVVGTSVSDTITMSYTVGNPQAFIIGGGGADTLIGGSVSETFSYRAASDLVAGETLNGGQGTDFIRIEFSGELDFGSIALTSIGGAQFTNSFGAATLRFNGNQVGSGQIDRFSAGSMADTLVISGTSINLNSVLFFNWAAGIDTVALTGTSGIDTITGSSQDDVIQGRGGSDALNGGDGNDIFAFENFDETSSDDVIDGGAGTLDTIRLTKGAFDSGNASFSGSTFINVERLLFGASGSVVAVTIDGSNFGGASGISIVEGSTDINSLNVLGTLVNLSTVNFVNWSAVDSVNLSGTSGVDTLTGTALNDKLNGFGGADTMTGGVGNDIYEVDDAADAITEAAGDVADRVQASVSYTLGAGVSIEFLETNATGGTDAISLTGNELAQTIIGNSGANTLDGGAGADTLDGKSGADTMIGGLGNDVFIVDNVGDVVTELAGAGSGSDFINASVTYTMAANTERLFLTGTDNINGTGLNGQVDVLTGNDGNNILNGLSGNDVHRGGLGNDTYMVDSTSDVIEEGTNAGTDIIKSTATFTMTLNTERLFLLGAANIDGTGLATKNDLIVGNNGANKINGLTGNDTLTGGIGLDTFVFTTALNATTNHDTITDFSVADDTIQLENAIFTLLTTTGTLASGFFEANSIAGQGGSEVVIYDKANGDLYYDTNGAGTAGGLVLFADVANNTALTAADFVVV